MLVARIKTRDEASKKGQTDGEDDFEETEAHAAEGIEKEDQAIREALAEEKKKRKEEELTATEGLGIDYFAKFGEFIKIDRNFDRGASSEDEGRRKIT